jgi:PIN domain nuclease of toxin-antitoxin system
MKYLLDTHAFLWMIFDDDQWQAIQRELMLISKDEHFKDYQEWGLKLLW